MKKIGTDKEERRIFKMSSTTESKHEFKAEIKKLLRILSKSLYQNKEIFLRELISNSVDALKKIYFISLEKKEDIEEPDLEYKIEITSNKRDQVLIVSDTGIGMTKEELIENLGTIAGSGTEKFLKYLKEKEEKNEKVDLDIIGQFGVGFYSVFMVVKKVEVITKSYKKGAKAYKWESEGTGEFTITETEKEHRGTDIYLYLNDNDLEYLEEHRIEEIVKKYSNFVPYPIYLNVIEEVEEKKEEEEKKEGEEKEGEEEKKEGEEKEGEEKKREKEEKEERKPINETEPLWKKTSSQITEEDYKDFYHYIANRYDDYFHVINYGVDGRVQFKSILYIPGGSSTELFNPELEYGLTVYSKNVLIVQQSKELIPQWLRFIKGVVDSDDIPLNISRETFQNNRVIMKIRELLVKKIIKEIQKIADEDKEKYKKFWKEFGTFIKEGIITDNQYRDDLLKLWRFRTTKTKDDEYIGLDEYIDRMQEGQEEIYYLIGESLKTLRLSPHLDYYREKNYEVILLDEAIDNFLMMNVYNYPKEVGEGDKKEKKYYNFKPVDVTEEEEKKNKEKEEGKEEGEDKDKEK
ncbi:MAG: molecular chaperone HtpG [Promethearchaeota archaeon]